MKRLTVSVIAGEKPRSWTTTDSLEFLWVKVEAGFETDGASIPIGLRWLFPHGGAKFEPAILHDKLYREGVDKYGNKITRYQADRLFHTALNYNGVPQWKAQLMYLGLRLGGWITWRKYRRTRG